MNDKQLMKHLAQRKAYRDEVMAKKNRPLPLAVQLILLPAALVMLPFSLMVILFLYKGDWREACDMELGTRYRKWDGNKRVK